MPSAAATLTPTAGVLRLMSWNVLYGGGITEADRRSATWPYYGQNRFPQILSALKAAAPDVLGLQELTSWESGSPPPAEAVAKELGMTFRLGELPSGLNLGIFSRWPINSSEVVATAGGYGVLRASVQTDGAALTVYVVHLHPTSFEMRVAQLEALLSDASGPSSGRTILLGDFNFRTADPEAQMLLRAGWQLAAHPPQLIGDRDQIWVSPGAIWSVSRDVWWAAPTAEALSAMSDHRFVSAEFRLGKEPTGKTAAATVEKATPLPATPSPTPRASSDGSVPSLLTVPTLGATLRVESRGVDSTRTLESPSSSSSVAWYSIYDAPGSGSNSLWFGFAAAFGNKIQFLEAGATVRGDE